nr:arginine repressor C-terminal-like domain-containing protein [Tanacetum cinerariifolium]
MVVYSVELASISVLVNGSPSKEFKVERGLRQCDLLSPFLFLMVVEALPISILEACSKGLYKGVYLLNNGANISLLQYADAAIFFGDWSRLNVIHLIHILKCFELASGSNKSKGLGVGSLVAKNLSLLGKWKWRFYTDKIAHWHHVIRGFYGEGGGFSTPINLVVLGAVKDPWCGSGQRLMDIFSRLFALDSDKDCKLRPTDIDKWTWSGDVSGVFHVRPLSKNIDNTLLSNSRVGEHHIWNSWIPRKVNICTWRASLNRIPTRSNLATREDVEAMDVEAVDVSKD